MVSPVLLYGCYGTFLAVAWFEFTYPGFAIAELTVFAILELAIWTCEPIPGRQNRVSYLSLFLCAEFP